MDRPGAPTPISRVAFADADTQPFTVVNRRTLLPSRNRRLLARAALVCAIAISLVAITILIRTLTSTTPSNPSDDRAAQAVGFVDTEAVAPLAPANASPNASQPSAASSPAVQSTTQPTVSSTATTSATATAQPSLTATLEPSPTATTAPSSTATSMPTSTSTALPTSTATATEIPTSTATATPEPTETAAPTETAVPTEEPAATETASPTAAASIGIFTGELVKNGGFEKSDDEWYLEAGARTAGINAADGQRALILPAKNGYADQTVQLVPGATYRLSAKGWLGSSTDTGEVGVTFFDADGNQLTGLDPVTIVFAKTTYTKQTLTFIAPNGATEAKVVVWKPAGDGIFAVDTISLRAVES